MFVGYDVAGALAGLLVGSRRSQLDNWTPAIGAVTVTTVVSRGIRLGVGTSVWRSLVGVDDLAWPLFGTAISPFVVYVRNDRPELRELRAVVVLQGDASEPARPRRLRAR